MGYVPRCQAAMQKSCTDRFDSMDCRATGGCELREIRVSMVGGNSTPSMVQLEKSKINYVFPPSLVFTCTSLDSHDG